MRCSGSSFVTTLVEDWCPPTFPTYAFSLLTLSQVRGVHISDAGEHGIVAVRCSGSSFTDNLIEDFGHRAMRRSDTKFSQTDIDEWNWWGDRWYKRIWFGLVCYVQPGVAGG